MRKGKGERERERRFSQGIFKSHELLLCSFVRLKNTVFCSIITFFIRTHNYVNESKKGRKYFR